MSSDAPKKSFEIARAVKMHYRIDGDDDGVEGAPAQIKVAHIELKKIGRDRLRFCTIARALQHVGRHIATSYL